MPRCRVLTIKATSISSGLDGYGHEMEALAALDAEILECESGRHGQGRSVSCAGSSTVLAGRWPLSCVNPTVLPDSGLRRWQPISMERGPNA